MSETKYDYKRQTWLERDGKDWHVSECSHPETMRPNCCYAGQHAGELIKDEPS